MADIWMNDILVKLWTYEISWLMGWNNNWLSVGWDGLADDADEENRFCRERERWYPHKYTQLLDWW